MKHKRVWTEEQKKAVGERLKAGREAKKSQTTTAVADPEVQAVINAMTPDRKAKLAMVQARQWQVDAQTDKATREALARHEAQKNGVVIVDENPKLTTEQKQEIFEKPVSVPTPPPVMASTVVKPVHPFRFTSGGNGLMVSELGVCLCGMQKLKWHPICLSR